MSIVQLLGSFPNSQVKPRPATQDESSLNPTVLANTVGVILAANPNRTTATIKNEGPASAFIRTLNEGPPASGVGFELEPNASINVESKEEYSAFADGGNCVFSIQERVG